MSEIDNPKVADLGPSWASFRGFSLLFDNPGSGVSRDAGTLRIDCSPGDPELDLYTGLARGLEQLGIEELARDFGFCALPFSSYHVTVWDGANDGNLATTPEAERRDLERFLEDLPGSLAEPPECIDFVRRSLLATEAFGAIGFEIDHLDLWNHQALVARLRAADTDSRARLERLEEARRTLDSASRSRLGIGVDAYSPHVTLGYFAAKRGGTRAKPLETNWNTVFHAAAGGARIAFESIGLYGFPDMARFHRRARAGTSA